MDGGEESVLIWVFLAFPRLRLALCGFGLWLSWGSALLCPQLGVGGGPLWPPADSPTGKKVQFEGCRTGQVEEKEEKNSLYLKKTFKPRSFSSF